MSSFLQSKEWLEFQRSLGRDVFEYDEDGIKAKIIKHDLPYNKNYLYIPHGPEIDTSNPASINKFINYLKDLGKNNKSIHIKSEPIDKNTAELLQQLNFIKSSKELQPSKTIILNLDKNEEELLSSMHQKTRYNIRVAERYAIDIENNKDIETFINLLKKTARRDRFQPHEDDYYRKLISLSTSINNSSNNFGVSIYSAKYNNKIAASLLLLTYNKTGFYLHGASDYNMRAVMAPFILHWHVIRQLKESGFKYYDMWGIDNKRWPGITRFKSGWGGDEFQRPGSFDLVISPLWYLIYEVVRKIF